MFSGAILLKKIIRLGTTVTILGEKTEIPFTDSYLILKTPKF